MNLQFGFSSALAATLLHSVWQLAILALLAALSFSALRHSSAMLRHAVGMGWLLAMLVVPMITLSLCWNELSIAQYGVPALSPSSAASLTPAVDVNSSWMDYLLVCISEIWLLGVVIMFAVQLGGWRVIRSMEQQTYAQLSPDWQRKAETLRNALGISRTVLIRVTSNFLSPFTAYVIRPIIWLPDALLTKLPMEQIEVLLAHEFAHIRRLDWLWNALQCVIESLLFFHPGMWWLSRRIRQEREHACDDIAIGVCGDAVVLAEALTALQQGRQATPPFALAAGSGSLMKRIAHLLPEKTSQKKWHMPSAVMLLVFVCVLLGLQIDPPTRLTNDLTISSSAKVPAIVGGNPEKMDFQPLPPSPPTHQSSPSHYSPPPPPPELPPLPGPPPEPPSIFDATEFTTLLNSIQADIRLVALVGTPIAVERDSFDGSIHTWGSRDFHLWAVDQSVSGNATFSLNFAGPNGRAKVVYEGVNKGGVWQASKFDVTSLSLK